MAAWVKLTTRNLYQAYLKFVEDNGFQMAAAVSFYLAVSFFPLLIVLISTTGLVFRFTGWGQDANQRLIELIAEHTSPVLAHQVTDVLSNVQTRASINGPIGLLSLIFAAIVVFVQFDYAMDRIWNVSRPKTRGFLSVILSVLVYRLRAFLMLLGVAFFATVGFIASMGLSILEEDAGNWLSGFTTVWGLITLAAAVVLNWLLFLIIYKALPKVGVSWSQASRGALFASIMWEAGRRLLAALVIGSKYSIYGVVGSFVAIMLWVFYATTILFLGGEYVQAIRERSHPESGSNAA